MTVARGARALARRRAEGEGVSDLWRDNGDKERVRDAADIVRVVGEHVALKPKGREYVGLCPFHDDHRPSMNVIPAKGIFHCFVCGTGGDVFSFVRRFHKMEFREALEYLAQKFGVTLTPRARGGEAPSGVSRTDLLEANAAAARFYRAVLIDEQHGRPGRELLSRRGISAEMSELFQIGLAPDRWDGLVLRVRQLGHDASVYADAGLLKRRDDGGHFDVLRNRLIFPIQDQIGRVIAFGGRRMNDEDEPKYLNSPDTRLFRKSATLYALPQASRAIQSEDCAIITEGYTDAIACHQGGFPHAVATLGTALTREHAGILRRLCSKVVLLFDGDEAGQRAADRAVEIFFAEPLDVKIVTLSAFTDAKDPDELLKREGGGEIFAKALAAAADLLPHRFARLRARTQGAGLSALSRAIDEEIARLAELGLRDVPPVRRAMIVKQLASLAGVDEETIRRAIPAGRAARAHPAQTGEAPAGDEPSASVARLRGPGLGPAEHVLGCILCEGDLWLAIPEPQRDVIDPSAYADARMQRIAQGVSEVAHAGDSPDLRAVLSAVDDLEVQNAATLLHTRVQSETQHDRERLHEHFRACLRRAELDRAEAERASRVETKDEGDALARIAQRRRLHTELGGDRRVLPRPG